MSLPFHLPADVDHVLPVVGAHLEGDRLLAYPTETVYGLGSAPREGPLEALSRFKGRPADKPFLLLVSGRAMAESWGLSFPPAADALAREFWPGPLTLVLPGGEGRLPDRLRGPEGGIAVRHTSHRLIAELVAALGFPLTSTSANLPGQPPAPGAEGVSAIFADAIAEGTLLVLDGGPLGNVPPSTIVDCTGAIARLVREGAIPRRELRRRVGRLSP
jgi:L-threonylcarbamoyladenylate synthase